MKLIWNHPVLEIFLGTACGGLLVLLIGWSRGGRMFSEDPGWSPRTKDMLNPDLKFPRCVLVPVLLDGKSTQAFPFLLNHPDKCSASGGAPFLLMLVMTRPQDRFLREAIRHTWGNETTIPGVIIRCLFIMGLSSDPSSPRPLEEDEKHKDLLQVGFLDTHHNQALKTFMGLEWVARYCPRTQYVLKVDGNVVLNPSFLVQQTLKSGQHPRPDFITGCTYRNRSPIQRQSHPRYMPPDMLSHTTYPPHCCSPSYVLSGLLALKVLSIARRVPAIHLEDVFVGLCLHHLGVELILGPPDIFPMFGRSYKRCDFRGFALVHPFKHQKLVQVWPDFQKGTCPLE
ncbi:beta-1,3-galactosyltransferase 2-like [Gracilinanus agilis]|uniref:beta-1,3-galactosyltransferase 2-like n=1 Tax=Gracilinanus agilis TaxID=191870 RepID=UPI001CFDDB4B|nr:beta-1,3-galactosyltransferase 2-like [Gracilinanus agilis]